MIKVPYIVTSILVVLAGLFAILNRFWVGFAYFVLTCLCLLCLFWGAWQIYKYHTDFKQDMAKQFVFFKANKINNTNITEEVFDKNLKIYQKEFKRKTFKDRFFKWCVIAFCFAMAVAFLLAMIFKT